MGDGSGNIQIGTIVIHRYRSAQPVPPKSPAQADEDLMSLEERRDLTDIILEIEMAEDDLIDAASIWQALTRHLNGRGLNEVGLEESLTHAQYWSARSYLVSWLSCRRGEKLPRNAMVRQILRMWEICPGLKPSTHKLCREHFQMSDLSTLNEVQLRAALWVTLADWQRFWDARAEQEP
ncbi:hypothetical protein CO2235_180055 [Cupriavidus oxalaticus]|nr:hypothetical protein CO2235_180055 [Cupriavidus oxalaticus]